MKMKEKETKLLKFLWGFFPWFVVLLLVAFLVTMGFIILEKRMQLEEARKAAMKEQVPPVMVSTLTLKPRVLADKIDLPATVESFENLWVNSEVSGQVVRIPVKEGQIIEKGQVLVELDDRDYRLRLERIQANHKLATLDHERVSELAKKRLRLRPNLTRSKHNSRTCPLNSRRPNWP